MACEPVEVEVPGQAVVDALADQQTAKIGPGPLLDLLLTFSGEFDEYDPGNDIPVVIIRHPVDETPVRKVKRQ